MQIIEFYITTYNSTTERVIETVLTQLAEGGHVKKWMTTSDESTCLLFTSDADDEIKTVRLR